MRLSGHLQVPAVGVDSFLQKNQGGYVDYLEIDRLRAELDRSTFIIEGVCLLRVLEILNAKVDILIYVQRWRHNHWADEEYLGIGQPLDEYLQKLRHFSAVIEQAEESEVDLGLEEEIIRYHHSYAPQNRADMVYVWTDL